MHVLSLCRFQLLRQHCCTVHIEVRTLGLTGKENLDVRVVFMRVLWIKQTTVLKDIYSIVVEKIRFLHV